MINQTEAKNLQQQKPDNNDILPASISILVKIGIVTADIKYIKPRSKRTHYRAIINWLTKYTPNPDASNLEKVHGYIEAFFHFGAIDEWENARDIIGSISIRR